ncbi:response regulator [Pacificoceanicola onchidii]|uniref:response regulator n=1 Tax=Pacificoceanicola onchidii TaxID=2562685 RepID=UPI0010A4FB38|nr:response regulator [Pacificoceanicola onchidii]
MAIASVAQRPSPQTVPQTTEPLKVLFLDDQGPDRNRLKRLCRKAGLKFQPYEAANLEEFRVILDEGAMDIVFLDYYLDMETGFDALKILTAHEDQVDAVPIMVTSVARHDIAVEVMRNGCADYLTKEELSIESVRKSIVSALERSILIAAIGQATSPRAAMRVSMSRLSQTCGPEIRAVLAATLRHVRGLRRAAGGQPAVHANLTALEKSCGDINMFLDEIKEIFDGNASVLTPDRHTPTTPLSPPG